jgi:hypothetical protein
VRADEPPPEADHDGAKIDEAPADEAPPPPEASAPTRNALVPSRGALVARLSVDEPIEMVPIPELGPEKNAEFARRVAEIRKDKITGRAAQRLAAEKWIQTGQNMRAIHADIKKVRGKRYAIAWIAAHTGYEERHVRDAIRRANDPPEKVVGKIGVGAFIEVTRRGVPAAALDEFLALAEAERTRKKAKEIAEKHRNATAKPDRSSGKKDEPSHEKKDEPSHEKKNESSGNEKDEDEEGTVEREDPKTGEVKRLVPKDICSIEIYDSFWSALDEIETALGKIYQPQVKNEALRGMGRLRQKINEWTLR